VTRYGCRRGKDSEGRSVTRKARRRESLPVPMPAAGLPVASGGTSASRAQGTKWWRHRGWLEAERAGRATRTPWRGWLRRAARANQDSSWDAGVAAGRARARWRHRVGSASVAHGRVTVMEPETWRTPWSAAGCNRPARHCAEKTVEVARNGKDGTCPGGGSPGPMVGETRLRGPLAGSGRAELMSAEGRSLDNPKRGVRAGCSPVWPTTARWRADRQAQRARTARSCRLRRRGQTRGSRWSAACCSSVPDRDDSRRTRGEARGSRGTRGKGQPPADRSGSDEDAPSPRRRRRRIGDPEADQLQGRPSGP
jgi:hypothetical protein